VSVFALSRFLKKLSPRSLSGIVVTAVVISVLLTESIVLASSMFYWQEKSEQEAIERIKKNWQSAIDTRTFPSVEELEAIALRFIDLNFILGVVIYEESGEEMLTVGQRPFLNLSMVRVNDLKSYTSKNTQALDIFIDPDEVGAAHNIIVRLDTRPIAENISGRMLSMSLAVLAVVLASSTAIVVIIYKKIVKPINKIQYSVRKVIENPDLADQYRLNTEGSNELAELSNALDHLFLSLSKVHQEELAALKKASEQSTIGILHYDQKGGVLSANNAIKTMIQLTDQEDIKAIESDIFTVGSQRDKQNKSIEKLVQGNDFSGFCELKAREGHLSCYVNAVTIRNRRNDIMRYVANIVDISGPMMQITDMRNKNMSLKRDLDEQKIREQELKQLLESCLCLLGAGSKRRQAKDFLPDRIVNDWYEEARAAQLVSGELEHDVLPWVRGDEEHVRNIFRQAMLLVYARSLKTRPTFYVEAKEIDASSVQFSILDISNKRQGGGAKKPKTVDYKLPLAALQKTLAAEQGKLVHFKDDLGGAVIAFTLANSVRNEASKRKAG
jgi:PAS domain-containing protein